MPSRGDVRPSGLEEASSLWRRLVLGFGAVVVVVVGIGIGAGGLLVQSAVDAEERELAGTLARVVSDSVHRISFSGKYHAQLLIDEYVEQQRDLVYVRIELLDGGLYAQAGRTPDGVQSLAAPPAIGDQLVRDLRVDVGRVREVVTPFLGGHDEEQVGYVRIGISREGAAARLRQAVVTLLAFGLLLTLSAMLAVHLTSRRFARPVQALAAEFAGILERTPLALCIQDRDGRIVRASTRFGRDFAAGAEVRGHQLAEFVDPGDRAALAEEDHRLLDGADTATPGDRAMILGLAYLANGATSDAVSYLEAARAEGANPHSVLPALARGYAELGRLDEAKAAEQAALAANAAQEQRERTTVALSATLTRLKAAWAEERYSEVEDAIADAWPLAPPRLRVTLQEYRVEVLAKTDRLPAARAAKDELDAMKAALTGDR